MNHDRLATVSLGLAVGALLIGLLVVTNIRPQATATAGPLPTRTKAVPTLTPALAPKPGKYTFTAAADTYVDESAPATNAGASPALRVDMSPLQRAYVGFDVRGLSGAVTRATLRVFAVSSSIAGFEVHAVAGGAWLETEIDYNDAPAVDAEAAEESGGFKSNSWVEVDVTPLVTGNGGLTLALTPRNSTAINLNSREATHPPQLIVYTGGAESLASAATRDDGPPGAANAVPATRPSLPQAGDPVMVGAGDIAGCDSPGAATTAELVAAIPGAVFTLGDNAYPAGTAQQFAQCYDSTWGQFKARTRPAAGNHDYGTSGAAPYYDYFGAAAGMPGRGYYSYDLGTWHIVVLNSDCAQAGGCGQGSAQEQWLRADLAANPARCTLAYWHHPLFGSTGAFTDYTSMQPAWQDLYQAGADIVLNGHAHNYERLAPLNPDGIIDLDRGIREFVVGTGGESLQNFAQIQPYSEVHNNSTFGVLKLTLHPDGYDWQFIPAAGKTFTDSGSTQCH